MLAILTDYQSNSGTDCTKARKNNGLHNLKARHEGKENKIQAQTK
jgi:hypothetical protein